MKITGKGVIAVIVLLVAIPLVIDFFFWGWPSKDLKVRMSGILFSGYLNAIPFYFLYLLIAIVVIRLFNKYKKRY